MTPTNCSIRLGHGRTKKTKKSKQQMFPSTLQVVSAAIVYFVNAPCTCIR